MIFSSFSPRLGIIFLICLLTGGAAVSSPAQVNYGAAKANASRAPDNMRMRGSNDYDYLALKDQCGPSGVPLGGVGVGYFDLAPNGHFTRVAINNWQTALGGVNRAPGTFLAVWRHGHAEVLELRDAPKFGMTPAKNTVYRGLFPIVHMQVGRNVRVLAWSGLVPHDLKDSSLPVAFVEVTVFNPSVNAEVASVAFSWQDVLGASLRDLARSKPTGKINNVYWDMNKLAMPSEEMHNMPPVRAWAAPFVMPGWSGFVQRCAPIIPLRATFQNYNDQLTLVCGAQPGQVVSLLPSYSLTEGKKAWRDFVAQGRLRYPAGNILGRSASVDGHAASAVAATITIPGHASRTVRFMVGWYAPPLRCGPRPGEVHSYDTHNKKQYGRYFQNYFHSPWQILSYAGANARRILSETQSWHQPVLQSSYPDWLKFKLINSAYTMYTNTVLNKQGDFVVMEGGMGGLTGTMDQRLINHEFYLKFFPEIDRRELSLFADNPGPQGQILHFDGDYYFGIDTLTGHTPVPGSWMLDNSGSWLFQLAEYYRETGDLAYLRRYAGEISRVVKFLHDQIHGKLQIPQGPNTYDDFWQPPINIYNASTYPLFMRCGAFLAQASGHSAEAREFARWGTASTHDLLKYLWNGRYFAYGCDANGTNPVNNIMASAQLAGQFLSRYVGFGDSVPFDMTRASLIAQMKTNLSHSPDYYAPKIWNIASRHAALDPGTENNYSTCWPFQLEAFTAMPLIQTGYVADGLDVMRHIQLVNLRNGWTWCQNLWNPGERAYVSAPVTWFITDVMASAALDLPHHTLHLAPLFLPGQTKVSLPLYYPSFWAVLTANRETCSMRLTITRVFSKNQDGMILDRIVAEPAGRSTSKAVVLKIPSFAIRPGAVLEFSRTTWHDRTKQSRNIMRVRTTRMDTFFSQKLRAPVLPRANTVPYMTTAVPRL